MPAEPVHTTSRHPGPCLDGPAMPDPNAAEPNPD